MFDHVGINVADLNRAIAWYTTAFPLTVEREFAVASADLRGAMLVHPGGARIELIERGGSVPGLRASGPQEAALTQGYGHIAFRVSDVEGEYHRLVAVGAQPRVAPTDAPRPGARMAWVADPEGNLIELISPREN